MLTKRTAAAITPATEFRVPSLADAASEYGELVARRASLHNAMLDLSAEKRRIEKEVAEDRTPRVRPGVAALLGDDPVDSRTGKIARLTEIKRSLDDHEIALATIARRITTARGPASAAVRAAVKPEYARRVANLCTALLAVEEARSAYEEIRSDLEAEDVEWSALGVVGLGFLGDREGGKSFHIQRVVREAREAGNYA